MSSERDKKVSDEGYATTFSSIDECEEKIEKLNKKLQATADELEEISTLYAKSVKESLDKSKRIKELEDKIDELEKQLKDCQNKRAELEEQLKECQDKNKKLEEKLKECQDKNKNVGELEAKIKELEEKLKDCQDKNQKLEGNQGQWIIGEYKWMPSGSTMPEGWVRVKLNKGFTLIQGEEKGETSGSVGKHNHTFWNNYSVWASKGNMAFINERTSGSQGHKYVPFVDNFNNFTTLKETADSGNGITNENLAAGIFAELWQYHGEKIVFD